MMKLPIEPTREQIQKRLDAVASTTFMPDIPGLEGLVLVKLDPAMKNKANLAYSQRLKELYAMGGFFSEALLNSTLKNICQQNGFDYTAQRRRRELEKRFYDSVPPEFKDPALRISQEELAEKSPEEQEEIVKALQERGAKINEFMQNFYKPEDYELIAMADEIDNLEAHIKSNTAEHHARVYRTMVEMIAGCRYIKLTHKEWAEKTPEERSLLIKQAEPYFPSVEAIDQLAEINNPALQELFMKWHQFKEGLLVDYFRPDNSLQ